MALKSIAKIAIVFSILIGSTMTFGHPFKDKLPCPSINTIRPSADKINIAQIDGENTFIAFSNDPFHFGDQLTWFMSVEKITASSPEAAVKIAKNLIEHADIQNNRYAQYHKDDYYLCYYGPGNIVATGFKV